MVYFAWRKYEYFAFIPNSIQYWIREEKDTWLFQKNCIYYFELIDNRYNNKD